MIPRVVAALLAGLASVVLPVAPLPAQESRPRGSAWLDATVGAGALVGGDYLHRTAFASDVTVGASLRGSPRGALVAALSSWVQAPLRNAVACPTGGECTGAHPIFYSVGVVAGWESRSYAAPSLRVLAGPAFHFVSEGVGAKLGFQARVDLAVPAHSRLALVVSARGTVIPAVDGETIGLGAIGLGVRVR